MVVAVNALDHSKYVELRNKFILQVEGYRANVYPDAKGIATIGIGFNLRLEDIRKAVFKVLIGDSASPAAQKAYLDNLVPVFAGNYEDSPEQLTAAIKAVSRPSGVSALKLTEGQSKRVLNKVSGDIEKTLDKLHVEDSLERVALFSLYYNSPKLLGKNLKRAIAEGDRAEAFYEIRYGSNPDLDIKVEARRYYESDVFGFSRGHTTDTTKMSFTEALALVTTLSRHAAVIDTFDTEFYTDNLPGRWKKPITFIHDSRDFDQGIWNVAQAKVIAHYDVFASTVVADFAPISKGVKAPAEIDRIDTGSSGSVLVLAGEGNNVVRATGANNYVFSGAGNDTIHAGGGEVHAGNGNNEVHVTDYAEVFVGTGKDVVHAGQSVTIHDEGGKGTYYLNGPGYDVSYIFMRGDAAMPTIRSKSIYNHIEFTSKLTLGISFVDNPKVTWFTLADVSASNATVELDPTLPITPGVEMGDKGGVLTLTGESAAEMDLTAHVYAGKGRDVIEFDLASALGSDVFLWNFKSGQDQLDFRKLGVTHVNYKLPQGETEYDDGVYLRYLREEDPNGGSLSVMRLVTRSGGQISEQVLMVDFDGQSGYVPPRLSDFLI